VKRILVATALSIGSLTSAYGAIVPGTLNFTGAYALTPLSVSFQCNQPGDTACATAPAGSGDFAVVSSTGSFAQYNGTFGLARNLNSAAQPLNTPIVLDNFLTFDLNNSETVSLGFIPLGTNVPSSSCAGLQHCTPQNNLLITPSDPLGLSAWNLDQTASGTTLTFGVSGTLKDFSGQTATVEGTFASTFAGLNAQQTLAAIMAGSTTTYSANFTVTAVPLPGSASLLAFGLAGMGLLLSRHRRARHSW
jgi:hypothetical protein